MKNLRFRLGNVRQVNSKEHLAQVWMQENAAQTPNRLRSTYVRRMSIYIATIWEVLQRAIDSPISQLPNIVAIDQRLQYYSCNMRMTNACSPLFSRDHSAIDSRPGIT